MSNGIIYIIDDEYEVRFTLENIFRFAGFKAVSFPSADIALEQNLAVENSCIVLDLNMPLIGGLEFQRMLREKGDKIPIVIYTGKANVDSAVVAMSDGAFTLIQKPAENHVLVEKVQEAINNFALADNHRTECKKAFEALSVLTTREFEIAELMANGCTAADIAERLFISKRTAEAHRASIFQKLHIKSVAILAQLILLADMLEQKLDTGQ